MAVDYAIELLIDNSISGTTDTYASLLRKVLAALESETVAVTYAASYSAGTTSRNAVTITVGGTGTVGFAIRVTFDRTAYGQDKVPTMLRRVIAALEAEALTIKGGGDGDGTAGTNEYVAGNRAYQASIAVS